MQNKDRKIWDRHGSYVYETLGSYVCATTPPFARCWRNKKWNRWYDQNLTFITTEWTLQG